MSLDGLSRTQVLTSSMETAAVPACDSVSRNESLEGETSVSALKGADLNGTQTKELIEPEVDG
jgi:hypothetical protein